MFCLLWTSTNSGAANAQAGPASGDINFVAVEKVPEVNNPFNGGDSTVALIATDLNFNIRLGGSFGPPQPTTVIQVGLYEWNSITGLYTQVKLYSPTRVGQFGWKQQIQPDIAAGKIYRLYITVTFAGQPNPSKDIRWISIGNP